MNKLTTYRVFCVTLFFLQLNIFIFGMGKMELFDLDTSDLLFYSMGQGKTNIAINGVNHLADLSQDSAWSFLYGNRGFIINDKEYIISQGNIIQIRTTNTNTLISVVQADRFTYFVPIDSKGNFYYISSSKFYLYNRSTEISIEYSEFETLLHKNYSEFMKLINDKMTFHLSDTKLAYFPENDTIFFSHQNNIYSWKVGSSYIDLICAGDSPQYIMLENEKYLYFIDNGIIKRLELQEAGTIETVLEYTSMIRGYKILNNSNIFFIVRSKPNFKGATESNLYVEKNGKIEGVKSKCAFLGTPIDIFLP